MYLNNVQQFEKRVNSIDDKDFIETYPCNIKSNLMFSNLPELVSSGNFNQPGRFGDVHVSQFKICSHNGTDGFQGFAEMGGSSNKGNMRQFNNMNDLQDFFKNSGFGDFGTSTFNFHNNFGEDDWSNNNQNNRNNNNSNNFDDFSNFNNNRNNNNSNNFDDFSNFNDNRNNNNSNNFDDQNSSEFLSKIREESLNLHNEKRKIHAVSPLVQDSELDKIAQKYAEKLAATESFNHSHAKFKGDNMGENLFMQKGRKMNGNLAVQNWYDEISDYNFNNPRLSSGVVGHFTQVVWKGSKKLGTGCAKSRNGSYYVVSNYYPAGNWSGKEKNNVFPK